MNYPKSLDGKVALVVGGSGAIGAATCRMLAQAGATVVLTHKPGERSAEVASGILKELPGGGHSAHPPMSPIPPRCCACAMRSRNVMAASTSS
jgi:NAD(P)-dependent dehydrogenase (short-subunit alcohol dehydrogenase family)